MVGILSKDPVDHGSCPCSFCGILWILELTPRKLIRSCGAWILFFLSWYMSGNHELKLRKNITRQRCFIPFFQLRRLIAHPRLWSAPAVIFPLSSPDVVGFLRLLLSVLTSDTQSCTDGQEAVLHSHIFCCRWLAAQRPRHAFNAPADRHVTAPGPSPLSHVTSPLSLREWGEGRG